MLCGNDEKLLACKHTDLFLLIPLKLLIALEEIRSTPWKWHLGTVRIFVHKDYRDAGLESLMLHELSRIAYRLGIKKLIAEIPEVKESTLISFKKAGFFVEASIPNLVKDRKNMPVDIVVMMKNIKPAHDDEYDYDF